MTILPVGLEEWFATCVLTFVVIYTCMYILVFLMCLMYDKDIFFSYPHLFVNRIPGKKVPRQKKAKIFLEGKSDIAINTDNKRNIKKRRRM